MIKKIINYLNFYKTILGGGRVEDKYHYDETLADYNRTMSLLNWNNCNPRSNGEESFISRYGKKWKIVFDVGADYGDSSKILLTHNENLEIHAFEPNSNAYSLLKNNINNRKCKFLNYAVGNKNSTIRININIIDGSQSSIYRSNDNTVSKEVKCLKLDTYVRDNKIKHVDFIKIDTEGNEINVLKGMISMIKKQSVDWIQFEYGGTYIDSGNSLKQAYELLGMEYVVCHMLPNGLAPLPYSTDIETFKYSNWIAMSRKIFDNHNI